MTGEPGRVTGFGTAVEARFAGYAAVCRGAPVAITWKLRTTWSFHTCYVCFISSYCKISKIID